MAGTLTISTLSDGTNSTSSTNCIQGSARAWVNFDGRSGASPVIRASYNISSVTRTATGAYTIAFTNAMSDANYSPVLSSSYFNYLNSITSNTTTQFLVTACTDTAANTDVNYFGIAVFR